MDSNVLFTFGVAALCGIAYLALASGDKAPTSPADASGYGSHGTGRWATREEILRHFAGSGPGAVLGRLKGRAVIHSFEQTLRNRFVVLIGPPGSGKTTRYSITNLLHAAEVDRRRSIVVTDPKGEMYRTTAAVMREAGFRVRVLNLDNPLSSERYNPMDYVHSAEDAMRLANAVIANTENPHGGGEAFWTNSERSLIAAVIWYVRCALMPEHQHLATVLHLIGTFHADPQLMAAAFAHLPPDHEARRYYGVVAPLTDKTRDGVFVGASVRLQLWAIAGITELTAVSDFDLRDLGQTPTVLYLIIPDSHSTYRVLTSLLFDQAFQELTALADAQLNGRLPVEVRLMLEEMANIGRIPDLQARLATIRSRGIIVEMVLQTLGQLKHLYGDASSTILGCSDTLCVLAVNDQETARYVSDRLGTTTIRVSGTSQTKATERESQGVSQHYMARPLLLPDEVQGQGYGGLRADDMLVIQRGLPPARIQKYPYEEHPGAAYIRAAKVIDHAAPPRVPVPLIDPLELPGIESQEAPHPRKQPQPKPVQQPQAPSGKRPWTE